jgi:alanine dehydrogenase
MNISVPRERRPGENRVGLTPAAVELLTSDVHLLASHGTETAIAECHPLARGVATHDGKIISPSDKH